MIMTRRLVPQLLKMVVLFNMCVSCLSSKKTLLPWNILSEDDQEVSFRHFFLSSIHSRLPTTSSAERYDLVHAEVGTSKEKLDKVYLDNSRRMW